MDKAAIEALKASRPILDVLRDLGVETQNGRFRCPRPENHSNGDRTPSVSVWPDRGAFKCWVCPDVSGDVIDLVRLVKGCGFREALEYLGAPKDAGNRRAMSIAPSPPMSPDQAPGQLRHPGPRSRHPASAVVEPTASGASPAVPLVEPSGQTALFASLEPAPAAVKPPASTKPPPAAAAAAPDDRGLREAVLAALIAAAVPVQGAVARYLQKRRIFKRTWDGQGLRMIDDYAGVSAALEKAFGRSALERAGFFNPAGNLRYYRHRLLFPYYDAGGKPVYLQARGIDEDVKPKELSMAGPIPLPYNVRLLDGEPGQIYLCEGIIDTLTLIEQGFPAVGVPGAANFKPAWAALFRGKSVHVAFDPDAPGENGAVRAIDLLQGAGIEARRLQPPKGLDLNDWFRKG